MLGSQTKKRTQNNLKQIPDVNRYHNDTKGTNYVYQLTSTNK